MRCGEQGTAEILLFGEAVKQAGFGTDRDKLD